MNIYSPYRHPRPPTVAEDATRHPEPSPCAVCGGQVDPAGPVDNWMPWRRHPACAKVMGSPAARVRAAAAALGYGDLTLTDAALVKFHVANYADHHDTLYPDGTKVRDRMPWRHLDAKAFNAAIKRLPDLRIEEGFDPAPATTGRCALCGVEEASRWMETDLTWPDGSPASVCGTCHPIYVRHGEPTQPTELRAVVAEAVTLMPVNMGEVIPPQLKAYVEVGEGPGTPFGHLDADGIEHYQWRRWTRFPNTAPVEHRAEARRRHLAERAAVAARTDQVEAERNEALGRELGFG